MKCQVFMILVRGEGDITQTNVMNWLRGAERLLDSSVEKCTVLEAEEGMLKANTYRLLEDFLEPTNA